MSYKADFERAKLLIQQKKVAQARQLLKTINHPLAEKWLLHLNTFMQANARQTQQVHEARTQGITALLNNLEEPAAAMYTGQEVIENTCVFVPIRETDENNTIPEKVKNNPRQHLATPWHPAHLMALCAITLVPGAGIAFALNWRRLGRSRWTVPTLILSGVSFLCSLSLVMLALTRFTAPEDAPIAGLCLGLAVALMLSLPLVLAQLQSQAYHTWKTQGKTAMLNHQYRGRNSLIAAGAFIVFSAISGAFMVGLLAIPAPVAAETPPETAANLFIQDTVQLTIPETWLVQDNDTLAFCGNNEYDCLLFLHPQDHPNTTVALLRYDLENNFTVTEIDTLLWSNVHLKGINLHEKRDIWLDAIPAILRTYTIRQSDSEAYELQIIAVYEQHLLEFTVHTETYLEFKAFEKDIIALYQSIQFLPELITDA